MANQKIPGINFFAPADVFDLAFWDDSVNKELIERLRLVFASYASSITAYGIADDTDPSEVTTGDTTRPLSVTLNAFNVLKIDVNPGIAVTPSGHRIEMSVPVQSIELASTGIDDVNVVYLQYTTKATTNKLTRYQTLVPSRREQQDNLALISVLSIDDYLNPSIVKATDLEDIVVLAVVDVETSTITPPSELVIDMTRDAHTFNRPRFTSVDIDHRQKLGTGISTDTNPHAVSVNDLSTSGLTLLQLIAPHGLVVSKDRDFPNVPGEVVEETFTDPGDILIDDISGSITGTANAKYVLLNNTPRRMGRVRETGSADNYLAGTLKPGTNVVWFHPDEDDPASFDILYSRVTAAEPPAIVGGTSLTFGQPVAGEELVIAGGISHNSFENVEVTFEEVGQFPRDMFIYIDAEGDFVKFPQVIAPTVFLETALGGVGLATNTIAIVPIGPAHIRVWMKDATFPTAPTLSVSIEINGTDENDSGIAETVTFDSTWVNSSVPSGIEELNSFQITTQKFKTVDDWRVTNRTDDGNLTQVILELLVDPVYSEGTRDFAPAAKIFWNGFSVSNITDIRAVNQTVFKLSNYNEIRQAADVLVQSSNIVQFFTVGNKLVLSEDFRDPLNSDLELSTLPKALDGIRTSANQYTSTSRLIENTRYISRAIYVGDLAIDSIQIVPFGMDSFTDIDEVGVRYSTTASPDIWIPAIGGSPAPEFTVVPLSANKWVFLPGVDVFKFQLYITGKCKGVAVVVRSTSTGAVTMDSLVVNNDAYIGGDLEIDGCIIDGICITDSVGSLISLVDDAMILRAQSEDMDAATNLWGTLNTLANSSGFINSSADLNASIDIVAISGTSTGISSIIIDAGTTNNILMLADDGSLNVTLFDVNANAIIGTSDGLVAFNSRFTDAVIPAILLDTSVGVGTGGIALTSSHYILTISTNETGFISGGTFDVLSAGDIDLVTTGSSDIRLESADRVELVSGGTGDINLDAAGDIVLTSEPEISPDLSITASFSAGAVIPTIVNATNPEPGTGMKLEFGVWGFTTRDTTVRSGVIPLYGAIPNGADTSSFTTTYYRDSGLEVINIRLVQVNRSTGADSIIGTHVLPVTAIVSEYTANMNWTLDHETNAYHVEIQIDNGGVSGNAFFVALGIAYTTDKVGWS